MQQLVRNNKEAKAMHKLISDIYTNGWYLPSIVTVTYDEKRKKYVAWDGNRRLTAMKILKEPKLVDSFKHFTYPQIRSIYAMSSQIQGDEFFQIPCYVADNFEECAGYIRNIHTTDTGALKWDTASIKRFEDKLGIKNIFVQLQGFCPKAFKGIDEKFPVSKFEKIVLSKVGKKYLNITFDKHVLMPLSSIEELEKKISKIVKDIVSGKITTEIIKTNENIERYLYEEEQIKEKPVGNKTGSQKSAREQEEFEQMELMANQNKSGNSSINNGNGLKLKNNKIRWTNKTDTIMFRNINCKNIDYSNERAKGIKDLCYEIQHLSFGNLYQKYPISYCFLIRSLLEQSSIYFLMNKGKWDSWKRGNNDRDLKLEKIIEKISKDKQNLIEDDTILRLWETCFNSKGMKNYLDLVIHHPYKVIADKESIKALTDMGMFAIIQFFIDS